MQTSALPFADWRQSATATAGVATATQAGVAGRIHAFDTVLITVAGSVAAAVQAEIRSGVTVLGVINIQAGAVGPIFASWQRPFRCAASEAASVVVPSLGAGVRCDVLVTGVTILQP